MVSLFLISKLACVLFYLVTGSRSSLVNMEARPLTADMLTRRCVVTRLSDLTIERFKEAIQTLGAGAMLILLPKNTSLTSLEQMQVMNQFAAACSTEQTKTIHPFEDMVLRGEFLPFEQGIFLFCKEWQQLERDLLTLEVPVAVYFAYEDKELAEIYEDIQTAINTDQAGSAFEGT